MNFVKDQSIRVTQCRQMSFKYRIPDYPLSFLIFLFIIFGVVSWFCRVAKSNFRQCHVWKCHCWKLHSQCGRAIWFAIKFGSSNPELKQTWHTELHSHWNLVRVHSERKCAEYGLARTEKIWIMIYRWRVFTFQLPTPVVLLIFCLGEWFFWCNITRKYGEFATRRIFDLLESKSTATDNVFYWKFIVFWQQQWKWNAASCTNISHGKLKFIFILCRIASTLYWMFVPFERRKENWIPYETLFECSRVTRTHTMRCTQNDLTQFASLCCSRNLYGVVDCTIESNICKSNESERKKTRCGNCYWALIECVQWCRFGAHHLHLLKIGWVRYS